MTIKTAATAPITQTCNQAKAFGTAVESIGTAVATDIASRRLVIEFFARNPVSSGRGVDGDELPHQIIR